MEKLKVTHDHSLTDILKVLIFAIVLLMPFLVYAPTALYYGFNEHATGTTTVTEGGWEVKQKYQTNVVNSSNDLIEGNIYKWYRIFDDNISLMPFQDDNVINVLDYEIENIITLDNGIEQYVNNTYFVIHTLDNIDYIEINCGDENITLESDTNSDETALSVGTDLRDGYNIIIKFYFELVEINDLSGLDTTYIFESDYNPYEYEYTEEVEVQKNITQMMEKNWDDLWETNLFKWTNTSILKNGLDNFTEAFGITNTSHINNLIAYELIMVGVYIVIDIVLALFKWLTHMIGNK